MSTASRALGTRTDARRVRETRPISDELEQITLRFPVSSRREVRRLVRSSSRIADVALTFPGVLYAIASRHGPPAARLQAIKMIEQGETLKGVAKALGLPFWLRKLPPEAFQGPLDQLPGSETFSRRIANRLPDRRADQAFWLASVAFAHRAAGEDFALWLAEQPIFQDQGVPERLFAVLAAYAWFSGAMLSRAHTLIVVPWRPEIAFDTALCAAKSWLNRMRLVMQLQPGTISDTWLAAGAASGLDFVPLTNSREILEEAHAMQNCADQYAERLARDKCRLFSVRRGDQRVATIEIGPHQRETGVLTIVQLKARHNMPAPLDVWQAAHAWLATQQGLKRLPSMLTPERSIDDDAWRQLMQPYRQRKGGAPWMPEHATHATLAQLDVDMADIARRGGVSSWLFT